MKYYITRAQSGSVLDKYPQLKNFKLELTQTQNGKEVLINIDSLEELHELMDEVTNDVVISLYENDDYPTIIIYDGYLE